MVVPVSDPGAHCRFLTDPSGVKIQELTPGTGSAATAGDTVVVNYVLRRANGYFIYSTVPGIGFQPNDVPAEPYEFKLVWRLWLQAPLYQKSASLKPDLHCCQAALDTCCTPSHIRSCMYGCVTCLRCIAGPSTIPASRAVCLAVRAEITLSRQSLYFKLALSPPCSEHRLFYNSGPACRPWEYSRVPKWPWLFMEMKPGIHDTMEVRVGHRGRMTSSRACRRRWPACVLGPRGGLWFPHRRGTSAARARAPNRPPMPHSGSC